VIPSGDGGWAYLAYFSKDLIFAALLLWPVQRKESKAEGTFCQWALPGAGLFLIGAFLSSWNGFNWVGALLTLRSGLILPLLAFYAAKRLQRTDLIGIARVLVLCALINCGLSLVQTGLPPDHILNQHALADSLVSVVEGKVRATGTFAYITGLGIMSSVGVWAGMVLLSTARDGRTRILALSGIMAGLGCALSSISRGPIVLGCLMLVSWVILSPGSWRVGGRSSLIGMLVLFSIGGLGLVPAFRQLGRAVMQRQEAGDDTLSQRTFGQLIEASQAAAAVPFGGGLGTEQVAGNYAAKGAMSFTTYETQLPRLIVETGILGLSGYLLICTGAMVALQQVRKAGGGRDQSAALWATQLLFIPMLYANIVFNHVASAFVWMIFAAALATGTPALAGYEEHGKRRKTRSDI
jgi:hypothetical protein